MLRRGFLTGLLTSLPLAAQQRVAATPLERLRASIGLVTSSINAQWGVWIKCLETGEEIDFDGGRQMDTMSTIKIPLMVTALRQVDSGRLSLGDRITLRDEDRRPGTGLIRTLDAGVNFTIRDLIALMVTVSDNTATDLMFRQVGGIEPVNQTMDAFGLTKTRATAPSAAWFEALRAAKSPAEFHREAKHPFGLSSPREMGKLLELIKTNQAASRKSCELMLEIMRNQLYRTRLPRYVTGFRIPHKTGDFLPYIANDVGIFESTGRNVLVCVFTANHFGSGEILEEGIGSIGLQVANYFAYRDNG